MTTFAASQSTLDHKRWGAQGFTLIEVMVVVAIMGVILLTGVPPFVKSMQQAGMRSALKNVVEACEKARSDAVITGKASPLEITGRTIRGGKFSGYIPHDVDILSVGVNFVEYVESDHAKAMFYPTGISDEFEITLQGPNGEVRQITLDIVTGTPVLTTIR